MTKEFETAYTIKANEEGLHCEVVELLNTSEEDFSAIDTSTEEGKQDWVKCLLVKTASHWVAKKFSELMSDHTADEALKLMLADLSGPSTDTTEE